MATKQPTKLEETLDVALDTAQKMLKSTQSPSNELQVDILKTANELIKTVIMGQKPTV